MASDNDKIIPIDYTHREYTSIREDLIGIAERFYPDTFRDFSAGSFGALMIDTVAYVGDQLSFYLDYNVNEMFLDTAYQFENIVRHGRIMGYKYAGKTSLYGPVALFILVPASATAIGPDREYMPILKRGTTFNSNTGAVFTLTDNVDFANSSNRVVVARVDDSTGAPTQFAVKAYGNVVSGQFGAESIKVGNYERFLRLRMTKANVSEIISVIDSEGNEYYEVENLSQDIVYKEIPNTNFKEDNVASIIKPMIVSRKFVVDQTINSIYLQFGSGRDNGATDIVANPQNVAMDSFGKTYISDTTFDPSRLSETQTLGSVPVNTTLTIVYRTTSTTTSNISTGGITTIKASSFSYKDRTLLAPATVAAVNSSLEVTNEEPIMGDASRLSGAEVKQRIFDTFPTQNRAVTQADYENLAYRMPRKFGSIERCSVQKDPNSTKRNLNMYVLSNDSFGKLTATNATIKNNLKTWLNHYRMINDTIDILDPYIINLGVDFVVRSKANADREILLADCIQAVTSVTSTKFYIGEHLIVSDIYSVLKSVPNVLDVSKVKIVNKTGISYSSVVFDINTNYSPDGSYIICPKNAIFEIKYGNTDITGKIT